MGFLGQGAEPAELKEAVDSCAGRGLGIYGL